MRWKIFGDSGSARDLSITCSISWAFVLCFSLPLLQVARSVSTESTDVLNGTETVVAAEKVYNVCDTEACQRTATEILSGMDVNTEPCVDFYSFVCKNWRQANPDLVGVEIRNQFVNSQLNHLQRMKELLEEPEELDETEGFKLARQLYNTCKKDDSESYSKQIDILRNIINEAGNWPLLSGTRRIMKNGWQQIDMYFMRKYSKSWLFDLTVRPDRIKRNNYVLTINPPTILRPSFMKVDNAENRAKYVNLIGEAIWNIIGHENYHTLDSIQLYKDIEDMIELEDRLITASSPKDKYCNFREATLQMMQDLFSGTEKVAQIDWISRLKMFLDINTEEPVYIACARHVEQLHRIISSMDEHIIINYTVWRFVVHTLPRIVDELRNGFYQEDAHKPRWQKCIEENEALSSIHYRLLEKDFSRKQTKKAADIYDMVDGIGAWRFLGFKDRLGQSPIRLRAYNLHEKMPLHFINPSPYFNETDYQARFRVEDLKQTYVENIMESMLHQHKTDINRIHPNALNVPSSTITPLEVLIRGGAFSKEKYVPAGAIQFPFYHPDRPQSVNYGAFGSIAAYSVMKEYYDYLVAAYRGDNRVGKMTEGVQESFRYHGKVTLDKWDAYPLKRKAVKDVVKSSDLPKVFEHHAESDALRAAHEGYMRDFKLRDWKDVRLPGLEEYNHEQLFFMSYVNAHCIAPNRMGHTSVQDLSEAVIADLDLEVRRKVTLSLLETKEFGEAFKCARGRWMHPVLSVPFW